MKRIIFFRNFRTGLLLLFFVVLADACKKELPGNDVPATPDTESGQVTPVGDVQEAGVTTVISTSGGTIQSADGRLHISIPAGAVTQNTTFSVQRISNTNIAGLGQAYRMLPHGTLFSKPVTISFTYDTADFEGASIDVAGIAYQDVKGVWQGSGAIRDTVKKTLSVSTTHFSDWSLFAAFAIYPASAVLEPGKSLALHVINYTFDDDLIPPTPAIAKPIGPQRDVTAQYIKEWKLGGGGNLQANGKEAVYTAPATIPSKNPVAVSVKLKGPDNSLYLLVSNIYISAEGVTFRINDGPWMHGTVPLGVVAVNGIHSLDAAIVPISGGAADAALSLKWTGYPSGGHINWGETLPWFLYQPPGNTAYQQFIQQGSSIIPSAGGIDFSRYSETSGADIMGSFILERAGKRVITATSITWTPVKIEGFFKTKRSTL